MDAAHKAQQLLEAKDYPAAIAHFTTALATSPKSPVWLIQRSTAYQRNNQSELAVLDAESAVLAARERGKRELIATAQFRRGIALHNLGRFGDARLCFLWCSRLNDKEKGLTMWVAKNTKDYEGAGEEAEENQIMVKEIPEARVEVKQVEEKGKSPAAAATSAKKVEEKPKAEAKVVSNTPAAPLAPTSKDKIRMEWYQNPTAVSVTIFAKGIPKENAEIVIEEGALEVSFPTGASGAYDFTASPLFSKIDTSKSSFKITPHKLEITLHKSSPGIKWSSLEGTEPIPSSTSSTSPTSIKIPDTVLQSADKPPAYPTSSRTGPKNWDTITSTADDDKEEGNVDDFFKTLYKDADPDTRRAMMKSYQESGGTALSTNWSDIGSRTVEISPPDGMEAKKWEY